MRARARVWGGRRESEGARVGRRQGEGAWAREDEGAHRRRIPPYRTSLPRLIPSELPEHCFGNTTQCSVPTLSSRTTFALHAGG